MKVGFTLFNEAGCEVASEVKEIKNGILEIKNALVSVLEMEDWIIDDGDTIKVSIISE